MDCAAAGLVGVVRKKLYDMNHSHRSLGVCPASLTSNPFSTSSSPGSSNTLGDRPVSSIIT